MTNTTIFGLSAVLAFSDVALIKYFQLTPTVWILLPLTLLAAWLMIQSASAK
jgi:hypothetical protein